MEVGDNGRVGLNSTMESKQCFPREAPFLHSVSQPRVSATEQTRSFAPAYRSSPVRSDFYVIIYFNDCSDMCLVNVLELRPRPLLELIKSF